MTVLPVTYLGSVDYFARLLQDDCVIDIGENFVKQTARNRADILTANGPAGLTVPVHGYGAKIATKDVRIDNSKNWQHRHWVSIVSAYRNSPFFDHYEERFAPFYARKFDFLADFDLGLLDVLTGLLGMDSVKISENYVVALPDDTDLRGKKALRRGPCVCNDEWVSRDYETEARNMEVPPGGAMTMLHDEECMSGGQVPHEEPCTPGQVQVLRDEQCAFRPASGRLHDEPPYRLHGSRRGGHDRQSCRCKEPPAFPPVPVEYTQVFSDRMDFVPGLSIIDLLFCESAPVARRMSTNRSCSR